MAKLQTFIDQYGPIAGPKMYRILQSRAAYKGVSTKRRRQIESLTGKPWRVRRRAEASQTLPLFPEPGASAAPEVPGETRMHEAPIADGTHP